MWMTLESALWSLHICIHICTCLYLCNQAYYEPQACEKTAVDSSSSYHISSVDRLELPGKGCQNVTVYAEPTFLAYDGIFLIFFLREPSFGTALEQTAFECRVGLSFYLQQPLQAALSKARRRHASPDTQNVFIIHREAIGPGLKRQPEWLWPTARKTQIQWQPKLNSTISWLYVALGSCLQILTTVNSRKGEVKFLRDRQTL